MHYAILARLLGAILEMVAVAMTVCFVVAWSEALQNKDDHAAHALGYSCLITHAAAAILFFVGRSAKAAEMLRKEAIAVVGLGWVLAAVFGSLPLWFDGDLNWVQSLFESMSGFTTTGSTVLSNLDSMPNSVLLWRSLTQWIGGLGILALFVALLSTFGVSGKSLLGAETSMNLGDSPTTRIKDLTLRLWIIYVSLTLVCWLGLWLIGKSLPTEISSFHALLYSLTTVSTAGFAPHDASVGHFDSVAIESFLCLFMVVSSLSMILLMNIAAGHFRQRAGTTEAVALVVLLLVAWFAVSIDLWLHHHTGGGSAAREAMFPVFAIGSTTGFASTDYDQWPLFARCVLMLLMIVGGCGGSTAGGVKVVRLIVMLRMLRHEVSKTFRPNRIFSLRIDGHAVDSDGQKQVLTYLAFVATVVLGSTAIVSLLEPKLGDFTSAFGAVFATFFNIGPGFGAVGPTDNFAQFHPGTLLFLTLLMLLGRLEIFAVVALFSRTLWAKY